MKRLIAALGAAGLLWLPGCVATTTYDPYYYDYAYYDPYYYGYDAWMTYGWVDPYGVYYYALVSTRAPAEPATAAIAARAPTFFTPSSCVTATADGNRVEYTFADCAGQQGIDDLDGRVTLTVTGDSSQPVMTATSQDLFINGMPYVLDLTATASRNGAERVATVVSRSRAPDQVDSREANATFRWTQGSGCVEVDGQSTAMRGGMSTTTVVDSVRRCQAQCPTEGTVTVQGQPGTFTAAFDGSTTLAVTGPDGEAQTRTLSCVGSTPP